MPNRNSSDIAATLDISIFIMVSPILYVIILIKNEDQLPTVCEKSIFEISIALSIFIMVICIVGFAGFFFADAWLLWVSLIGKLLLIVILFSFIVFTFVVTNEGEGEAISGRGFKEYKLGEYSNWLQKRMDDNKNWAKIRACLVDKMACQSLKVSKETYVEFYAKDLSAIQSGCCKPPSECDFQYVSPTVWKNNTMVATSTNPDCLTWKNDVSFLCRDFECMKRSNDVPSLCYNCQSCKAAMADRLSVSSGNMVVFFIAYLILIVIAFALGCYAFRNNRRLPSHVE